MKHLFPFAIFLLLSCTEEVNSTNVKENRQEIRVVSPESKDNSTIKKVGMANPALLSTGRDIGRTFNAYYKTGQVEKMINLLCRDVILKYSEIELDNYLSNLQFGYDMKFNAMRETEGGFLLNYTCDINATKIVKQLKVVIESDTARICPSNLEKGLIFSN